MAGDYGEVCAALKLALGKCAETLATQSDTGADYTLVTKSASPFPQHKEKPLFFASVRNGKAYASFHLMPLYMCPELKPCVPPELKKRMQGLACFNFKSIPDAKTLEQLAELADAALKNWAAKKWL